VFYIKYWNRDITLHFIQKYFRLGWNWLNITFKGISKWFQPFWSNFEGCRKQALGTSFLCVMKKPENRLGSKGYFPLREVKCHFAFLKKGYWNLFVYKKEYISYFCSPSRYLSACSQTFLSINFFFENCHKRFKKNCVYRLTTDKHT